VSEPGGKPLDTHHHSPGFLALVQAARQRVATTTIERFVARTRQGERVVLIDTREDREWGAGHLPGAKHLSKGVIERDIEQAVPDKSTPIVCYCGGGYRSVLVCENLMRMGYTHCESLDGGWREWNALGLPVETPGGPPGS
jgi:rhodanese-related sulfurtransferase